jgi:hypothetical protein
MPRCSICGEQISIEELLNDICLECAKSKLQEDDLDVGMDDFS